MSMKSLHRPEWIEVKQTVDWIRYNYPNVTIIVSAVGFNLSWTARKRLKMMGYERGTPDLFIARQKLQTNLLTGYYAGLFIEMKREKGGVVSPEQKEMIERLNGEGYRAVICHGIDEAIVEITEYLG